MRLKVALVGNPNCGKSTLFNALTHGHAAVGNWGGVTADLQRGFGRIGDWQLELLDLPGLYSLAAASPELQALNEALALEQPDLLLQVLDGNHLQRGLWLTAQLTETGIPLVLAVNFSDELQRQGRPLDAAALSRLLALPCVTISAARGWGLDGLADAVCRTAARPYLGQSQLWPGLSPAQRQQSLAALCAQVQPQALGPDTLTQKLDKLLCGPLTAGPTWALLLFLLLFLSFGPAGRWLGSQLELALSWLRGSLAALLALWRLSPAVQSLFIDGILSGVGGVLVFLPQLGLIFLGLALLEASGCLARLAFLCDHTLARWGLSGHSALPLLLGLGCTVPAVLSCRNLPDARQRRLTLACLPWVSCSARLPVYLLLTAAVFPRRGWLLVAALYAGGLLLAAAAVWLGSRLRPAAEQAPFLLELPPYRRPVWRQIWRVTGGRLADFLSRAAGVLLLAAVAIWAGSHFTPELRFTLEPSASLLAWVGDILSPLLTPWGCGYWQIPLALLSGLLAKEAIAAAWQVLYGGLAAAALAQLLTPPAALALLTFILLYAPCAASLAALKQVGGSWRFALLLAAGQTLCAWLLAWLFYGCALLFF